MQKARPESVVFADITKAGHLLGYAPIPRIGQGLQEAMNWYIRVISRSKIEVPCSMLDTFLVPVARVIAGTASYMTGR